MTYNSFHDRTKSRADNGDSDSSLGGGLGIGADHYYQNENLKKAGGRRRRRRAAAAAAAAAATATGGHLSNHSLYYHNHGFILNTAGLGSNSSAGIASSTASSDRPLILRRKKFKLAYFLLILAVLCLTLSLVSIAISFIFPFWVTVTLLNETNNSSSIIYNGTVVITNQQSNISLVVVNDTIDLIRPCILDLGIWEVKMHSILAFLDRLTNATLSNNFPTTMLWLNVDSTLGIETFLLQLLAFIDVPSSTLIFVVQLLEIVHIVFTLLSLCFTSFTLCLCTSSRSKSSLCWYLIAFIMCLVSFLTGLGVVVLILFWQASPSPLLVNQFGDEYFVERSLNWCFWLAVGIDSSILLSAFLILLYILIRMILIYIRNRTRAKASTWSSHRYHRNDLRPSRLNSRTSAAAAAARLYHHTGGGISIDDIDISHFSSRLPRIPISGTTPPPPPPPLMSQFATTTNTNNNNQHLSRSGGGIIHQQQYMITGGQQPTTLNSSAAAAESSMRSPSYIFYTGHGNYHKQEIDLKESPSHNTATKINAYYVDDDGVPAVGDDDDDEFVGVPPPPPPPPPLPPTHPHLINYSYVKNVQQLQQQLLHHNAADHPYSNVVEQTESSSRFNNFR